MGGKYSRKTRRKKYARRRNGSHKGAKHRKLFRAPACPKYFCLGVRRGRKLSRRLKLGKRRTRRGRGVVAKLRKRETLAQTVRRLKLHLLPPLTLQGRWQVIGRVPGLKEKQFGKGSTKSLAWKDAVKNLRTKFLGD